MSRLELELVVVMLCEDVAARSGRDEAIELAIDG